MTPTYSLIASNGICGHINGGFASSCFIDSLSSIKRCEAICTSQTSCVAYYYGGESGDECNLYVSDNICPNEFFFLSQSNTAKTIDDLKALESSYDAVCYGKGILNLS